MNKFNMNFQEIKKYYRCRLSVVGCQPNHGFVLALAVLISAVVLSIGLSVYNIISKEIVLASSGRESHFAFYSADVATECALFWDVKQGIFATSSDSLVYGQSGLVDAKCDGVTIRPIDVVSTATAATSTFSFAGADYCATVVVAKYNNGGNTTINSYGYNTCVASDPFRSERAIQLRY